MSEQRPGTDEDQVALGSGNASAEMRRDEGRSEASPRKPTALEGSLLSRVRRRTVVTVAAGAAVLAAGALAVSLFTGGGSTPSRLINGNTVEYTAGHRPLVPDITGISLTGAPIKMSDYRGKVLVLNFWGSWCAPCRAEAPTLEVAYEEYHPRGVDFLGDDLDDPVTNALSFIRSESISYPSINDASYSVVQQFSQAALVNDPPTTAVIDKAGHIVGLILGRVGIGDLATLLQQAQVVGS
jgi:thiol-disulfide isomerase/thioredoxin